VNDYLVTAVQRQLESDAVKKLEIQPVSEEMDALIRNIRLRRERILAERNGEFIDVDAIIELVRNEWNTNSCYADTPGIASILAGCTAKNGGVPDAYYHT